MSLINEALAQARTEAAEQERARSANQRLLEHAAPYRRRRQSVGPLIIAASLILMLAVGSWAFVFNFGGGVSEGANVERSPAPMAASEPVTAAAADIDVGAAATVVAPVAAARPVKAPLARDEPPQTVAEADTDEHADQAALPVAVETAVPISERSEPARLAKKAAPPSALRGKTFTKSIDLDAGARLSIEGIVWSISAPVALINGSMVRPGDELLGVTVLSIEHKRVKLALKDTVFYLRLPY